MHPAIFWAFLIGHAVSIAGMCILVKRCYQRFQFDRDPEFIGGLLWIVWFGGEFLGALVIGLAEESVGRGHDEANVLSWLAASSAVPLGSVTLACLVYGVVVWRHLHHSDFTEDLEGNPGYIKRH
jgi:hypothetical protein